MLLDGNKVSKLVKRLHREYNDSYRYIFLVVKWMIRRSLCYENARDLCELNKLKIYDQNEMKKISNDLLMENPAQCIRDFDDLYPSVLGKNVLVREVVQDKNLGGISHKAPSFLGAQKVEVLEDVAMKAIRKLSKKGACLIRNDLIVFDIDRFEKLRFNDDLMLDRMLDRRYGWWDPPDLDRSVKVIEEYLDIRVDREFLKEFLLVDVEDNEFEVRLAELLYKSKQFCFDICAGRIRSGLFYYMNGYNYQEIYGNSQFELVMRVTDNFDGFEANKKYQDICNLLSIESFPTGDLLGKGDYELIWTNGFYPPELPGVEAKGGARMKFDLIVNQNGMNFDPMRAAVEFLSFGKPDTFTCGSQVHINMSIRNRRKKVINFYFSGGRDDLRQTFIVEPNYNGEVDYPVFQMFGVRDGRFIRPELRFKSDDELEVILYVHYRTFKGGKISLDDALSQEIEMAQF